MPGSLGPEILVIDDDDLVRRSLVRGLRRRYVVTDLADAESALALIEGGAHFDAILCDLNLCGMSGREFLFALEVGNQEQAKRVVILSGESCDHLDPVLLAAVGRRVLEKPASTHQIDVMLATVVTSQSRAA